jgi:hypothetical protein
MDVGLEHLGRPALQVKREARAAVGPQPMRRCVSIA